MRLLMKIKILLNYIKMLELIRVWDLYKSGDNDFQIMEMETLKCFEKLMNDYEYIFKESEKKGRWNGEISGGKDTYQRVNDCFVFDVPNREDIKLKDDNDYDAFRKYIREGMHERNCRVVAELTRSFQIEKQAREHQKSVVAKQKHSTFTCEICNPPCYTNSPSVWEAHICTRSHIKNTGGDPRQYTCDACGEEFENTRLRNKHVDGLKCFQSRTCKDCNAVLSSKQRYQEHFINGICNVMIKNLITSGQLDALKCKN